MINWASKLSFWSTVKIENYLFENRQLLWTDKYGNAIKIVGLKLLCYVIVRIPDISDFVRLHLRHN